MPDTGYVRLYRKLLDNPVVCKDADHIAVWVYLLLNATWKSLEMMFEGNKITLNPGQLITGRKAISSKIAVDEYKVQRILKLFENEQLIAQQTTPRNRLISVLNWKLYQPDAQQDEQQLHNNCTTTAQQLHTNNKDNKDNNVKNDILVQQELPEIPKPVTKKSLPTLDEVRTYCLLRANHVDPEKFFNHYTSNGWMVGKNKMKDWQAAVRTWEKNDSSNSGLQTQTSKVIKRDFSSIPTVARREEE